MTRRAISIVGERLDGFAGFERRVWAVAVVVVVGALMSILNTTSVNVALAALSRDHDVSIDHIQWVVTAYLLALASVIPLTGWAAERFGVRSLWMTTTALFVAASILCGLAWSANSLIAFRVVQGLAGGMIMPVGMIVLTLAAGPERMGRAMSVIGVPMLLGPALGPVLGGLLVEAGHLSWIFYINVPIGVIGLALAWRLLPSGKAEGQQKLDLVGLLLASPGIALLTLGISEIPSHGGVGDPVVYGSILAGAALLGAFVRHARRESEPLIDVRLFANPRLGAAVATTFLLGVALFGSLLVVPLYFQFVRGEDALTTGLLLVPQALGAAASMVVVGRLADRVGAGRIVLAGVVILALGTLALTQVGAETSYVLLLGAFVVRGVGLGTSMMPAMAAAYATLRPEAVPRATSGMNVMQRVGGSIGAALLAVILNEQIASAVGGSSGTGQVSAGADPGALAGPLGEAFAHTFWWAFALTLVAIPPAIVLARREVRARSQPRHEGAAAGVGA